MKLKNKYSKQNIYSNQKFEDQIWYNQQIMTFLNFSKTSGKCFPPKFFRKTLSWKPSQIFLLLESVFHWLTFLMANKHKKVWKVISRKPLSGKQTQLKRKHFPKNQANFFFWLKLTGKCFSLTEKCFLLTRKCFLLTGKCFLLTSFPNDKETQESLENGFPETTFRETNMALRKRESESCGPSKGELEFWEKAKKKGETGK